MPAMNAFVGQCGDGRIERQEPRPRSAGAVHLAVVRRIRRPRERRA
jgi:hypothetical protein